jgi:hypothetical protein
MLHFDETDKLIKNNRYSTSKFWVFYLVMFKIFIVNVLIRIRKYYKKVRLKDRKNSIITQN